jgi:hypothetical protein
MFPMVGLDGSARKLNALAVGPDSRRRGMGNSWYDYVPVVGPIAEAAQGNWSKAGTDWAGKPYYDAVSGAVTPTKPDLSASQGANQRAQDATKGFAAERQAYQPMSAPQIGAYGGVSSPAAPAGGAAYTPPNPNAIASSIGARFGAGGFHGAAPSGAPGAPPGAPPAVAPPGSAPGAGAAAAYGATNGPSVSGRRGIDAFGGASYTPPGGGPSPVSNQSRQQGALDMLQGAALGATPSAAQIQSGQQLGTAMANQYALASGLQGRHPGAAFDAAARGAATVQGNVIGQGVAQRAAEQAQARDAYANAVGGARGQDIQTDVANLNAKLQTMGYDQQTRHDLLMAQLQAQGYDVQSADAIISAQAQAAASANQYKSGIVTTIGQVGGAALA